MALAIRSTSTRCTRTRSERIEDSRLLATMRSLHSCTRSMRKLLRGISMLGITVCLLRRLRVLGRRARRIA